MFREGPRARRPPFRGRDLAGWELQAPSSSADWALVDERLSSTRNWVLAKEFN